MASLRVACLRGLRTTPFSRRTAPLATRHFSETAAPTQAKVPTLEEVRSMPTDMAHLTNESVYVLAEQGHPCATYERLIRHVMVVDEVEYGEAKTIADVMENESKSALGIITFPYKVGIATSLVAGWGCLPMIFHQGCAEWFNHHFVTTDVPDDKDLETVFEVGSWTWNWMEPPLGALSFTLLCLQFTRAQMENWGVKPYSAWVRNWRADKMVRAYPKYNEDIVREFVETRPLRG